jgi:hypothetical protein
MQKLIIVTMVSVAALQAAGCSRSRTTAYRPVCTPAPSCCTDGVVVGGTEGVITSGPMMSAPQVVPGPETYTPAPAP